METTQAAPEWRAIADEIWAIIRENAQGLKDLRDSQKETSVQMKETDRRMKEAERLVEETSAQMKETDKQMKETSVQMKETDKRMKEAERLVEETSAQMKETSAQMKETDKQMKETDRRFGYLSNRFGEIVEYMIMPNLVEKFDELGFVFTKANRSLIKDKEHGIFMEVDALLENGDKVLAVEIKTKPNVDDINCHIERMEKLRKYADLHGDRRVYLGAIAGVVFNDSEKMYALKQGLYVVEPSGETFKITVPKGAHCPREW